LLHPLSVAALPYTTLFRSKTPMPIKPKFEILPQAELSLLIVDDDPAMLRLLKEVCHHLHLNTFAFNNFYEIEKNAKLDYDLVLRSEEHTSELQSRENLVCR